ARRGTDAGLHRRTVALVVRMPDDARSGVRGFRAGAVTRSIVDDEDLVPWCGRLEVADDAADRIRLVEIGNHDGCFGRSGHPLTAVSHQPIVNVINGDVDHVLQSVYT